jgi:hypothetical protein
MSRYISSFRAFSEKSTLHLPTGSSKARQAWRVIALSPRLNSIPRHIVLRKGCCLEALMCAVGKSRKCAPIVDCRQYKLYHDRQWLSRCVQPQITWLLSVEVHTDSDDRHSKSIDTDSRLCYTETGVVLSTVDDSAIFADGKPTYQEV